MAFSVVTIVSGVGPDTFNNVHMVSHPNSGYDDAEVVCHGLGLIYEEELLVVQSQDYELREVRFLPITSPPIPEVTVVPPGWPQAGSSTADLLPTTVAALVTFRSLTIAPNRGWKYIAGFSETGWSGDGWIPAVLTALDAWAARMVDLSADIIPGVDYVGARRDPLSGSGWNIGFPFTQYQVATYSRTQRRRRPGVGS